MTQPKLSSEGDRTVAASALRAPGRSSLDRSVGEVVRQNRIRRGLTLTDLARASDVSLAMLSRLESGRTAASLGVLDRICVALGADLADVFREVEAARRGITLIRCADMALAPPRRSFRAAEIRTVARIALGSVSVEALRVTVEAGAPCPATLDCAGRGLIILLSGAAEATVDGVAVRMGAGDALHVSVPAILPVRALDGDAALLSIALVE